MRIIERYTGDYSVTHWAGKKFIMNKTLGYHVCGESWCIEEGQKTDFSSTPGPYDLFVKPVRVNAAGAIHDSAYQNGVTCTCSAGGGREIKRSEADKVWRLIAQYGQPSYRANLLQAWAGWIGLRLGGWVVWRKYRRSNNSNAQRKG